MDEGERQIVLDEIDEKLSQQESEFIQRIEEDGDGVILYNCLRNLLAGGNYGLEIDESGDMRGIPLNRYVTLRDPSGRLLEFCIKDCLDYETLPDDVKQTVQTNEPFDIDDMRKKGQRKTIDVYTYGVLRDGRWHIHQEVCGHEVEGSGYTLTDEARKRRFIFARFVQLEGEHYGRSYCEDYEADLQTVDGLTQIVLEGSSAAALFIRLVKPGGHTSKTALEQAANGAILTGIEGDVVTLDANKNTDFASADNQINRSMDRLARAFLVNSSVGSTTQGRERVTAEEIRFLAAELDEQLGGAYSAMLPELQRPYSEAKMRGLQRSNRLIAIPESLVSLIITTGPAALGRHQQIERLVQFISTLAQFFPEVATRRMKFYQVATRMGAALRLPIEGLVLTDEEFEAMVEEEQQRQAMSVAGPEMLKQAGQFATQATAAQIRAQGTQGQEPQQ